MKIIAASKAGANKFENEDRIIVNRTILSEGILTVDFDYGILAIADGVGGNNAGAVASHFIANRIGDISTLSRNLFGEINKELIEKSNANNQFAKMATTLSGIQVSGNRMLLFHVGNTRVFSLQSGKYLKQLTSDDTTVNYLLTRGQITTADAEKYEKKNEIISCFGGGNENILDIKLSNITNMNITKIIITSDGIHDYVSIDEIEDIFAKQSDMVVTCQKLMATAIENGSCDDMSILIGVV